MAQTKYFRHTDGTVSIPVTGGTQIIMLDQLSYDLLEHYFFIIFKDSGGNQVTPGAGTVTFEGSPSARNVVWDTMADGTFNAIDVDSPSRNRPKAVGPLVSARLTVDGVTGADFFEAKVTGY